MGLPAKALKKSQLKFLAADPVVSAGSHKVSRVHVVIDGVKKLGFYKAIHPAEYPEFLARMCVGASVVACSSQGKRSAEERLVFNKKGKLVGTLSIAIEGFKPLNIKGEEEPIEPSAKELVIPSTKTLIKKEMNDTLVNRFLWGDDDCHPKNIGLTGSVDYEMFFYPLTRIIKPRPILEEPRDIITVRDWERFPCIEERYHWPTHARPGENSLLTLVPKVVQESVPKVVQKSVVTPVLSYFLANAYPDPAAFQMLAKSEEAQQQKLASALKTLLTFDPIVLRARLVERLGEMPLNYTSLGPELSAQCEKEFPTLFNAETDKQPFADFMMSASQSRYDVFYPVVALYMGCADNGFGVRLPAMYRALYEKPSLYRDIKKWIEEQNKSDTVKYNLDTLERRYHQVWRDATAPRLETLLQRTSQLTSDLIALLKSPPESSLEQSFVQVASPEDIPSAKSSADEHLTRASELFGPLLELLPKDKIIKDIDVDPDSDLSIGLRGVIDFTNALTAIIKTYYAKSGSELTVKDNADFVESIQLLCNQYRRSLKIALANTSSYSAEMTRIISELDKVAEEADFEVHLTTTDELVKAVSMVTSPKKLPLTHEDTLKQFNDALFNWAKHYDPIALRKEIVRIVETYYTPTFSMLSYRGRTDAVKAYLTASEGVPGHNLLAYLLSSGTKEDGALNKFLIEHLTPLVLKSNDLRSIKSAVKAGTFAAEITTFTRSAVQYAKTNEHLIHLCHEKGIRLFYETLFSWVEGWSKETFNGVMKSALSDYAKQTWWAGRKTEVEGYCRTEGQAQAVASTFLKEGKTSTLNQILFKKIVSEIQKQVKTDKEKQDDPGYKLLAQYKEPEHLDLYLNMMVFAASDASHKYRVKEPSPMVSVLL